MGVRIQALKKCGFLRQVAQGAMDTTSTLKEALLATQKSLAVSNFMRGRLLVSQSGSGQSGSFQISMSGAEWTQDNVFGLIEELLQMLETADPVLYPDDADAAHTEALRALLAENVMLGNVPGGVTATGGDFTLLNIPVFGTGLQT